MAAVRWSDIGNWNFFFAAVVHLCSAVILTPVEKTVSVFCCKTKQGSSQRTHGGEFSSFGLIKVSPDHAQKGHECRFSFSHIEAYRFSAASVTAVWWHGSFSTQASKWLRFLPVLASSWCGMSPWCAKQSHSSCPLWSWWHHFRLVVASWWHFWLKSF